MITHTSYSCTQRRARLTVLLYFIPTKAQTSGFFVIFSVITSVIMKTCHYVLVEVSVIWERWYAFFQHNLDWAGENLSPAHNLLVDLKPECFTWPTVCRCQNLDNSFLEWVKRNRHLKDLNHLPCSSHHTLNMHVPPYWFVRDPMNLSTKCKSSLHVLKVQGGEPFITSASFTCVSFTRWFFWLLVG